LPPGADAARLPRSPAALRRALDVSAALGSGMLVPFGLENKLYDGADQDPEEGARYLASANRRIREQEHAPGDAIRILTSPTEGRATTVIRGASGGSNQSHGLALYVNPALDEPARLPEHDLVVARNGEAIALARPACGRATTLGSAEVRLETLNWPDPPDHVVLSRPRLATGAAAPRIAIESPSPLVDAGRFPAKRTVHRSITIEADIFSDGHDRLAARVCWRAADEKQWTYVPMLAGPNDRWHATVHAERVGEHVFQIEAWWDPYASLLHDLTRKRDAGVSFDVEVDELRTYLARLCLSALDPHRALLDRLIEGLSRLSPAEAAVVLATDEAKALIEACHDRPFLTRLPVPGRILVERRAAEFSSWYELFPRSITDRAARHGRFEDVIQRLPAIRAMGFDVLYFPPIHPIGHTNRKGPNNALTAGEGDVGSPYAIGSTEGGHDALHPALGNFDDFRRLVAAARDHGLELALDFAIQCSPDHPWLREHPDWFRWRADGSIRYAENPPKKYEDIVNVDFYPEGSKPALWEALRDIVLFWIGHGVRVFRVDNPHTKPLPFWEWLLADIRARHPDCIFLSEAFTRPKMMYRLAKLGFSQSYTYFTWRNTKSELTAYVDELTNTAAKDFFRPHFFVNTPDINPHFLQNSGRAGFLIRAALAATLSGLWGVYSGFELCEASPVPGKEEYLDSEKYELRVRNFAAPGNIVAEISALNRLRRRYPALQTHLNAKFYRADDDHIVFYGKMAPDGADMVLVAVNLDPHRSHHAAIEIPLWEWNLPDHGTVAVENLLTGQRFEWTGKRQAVALDPHSLPYDIWRIAPKV
jgi:starch synthase (maltosyl-transferring)